MSEDIEVINLYVNRNYIYDLSLNNVSDSSRTSITFSVISSNKYKSTNEPICKFQDYKLIPYNEGICDLLASTSETQLYNKGKSKVKRLIITKNEQIPLVVGSMNNIYYNNPTTLNLIGGSIPDYPIIYTCDASACIINNDQLTFTNVGNYSIKATKLGNFMYNDVSLIFNLNVLPISQSGLNLTITGLIPDNKNNLEVNIDRSITYTLDIGEYNENPNIIFKILYTSSTDPLNPICKIIDNNKLMAYSEGECILQGTTYATTNYLSTDSQQIKITVLKNYQTDISLGDIENLYYKSNISLNPSGGNTDGTFSYDLDDSVNCTLSGNMLLGNSAGECIISVTKGGDDIYQPITNDFEIQVKKIKQSNAYIYLLSPNGDYIGKSNDISGNSGEITSTGYQLDDQSSYINVTVNRDISFQLITGNVSDNAIAKYKIIPRNMLDNEENLFYYYTFNIDSIDNVSVFNNNYLQKYDAKLSISGLVSTSENIYGPGSLVLDNKQYVTLKPLFTDRQGITISFWGKMNKSPDKTLFFSFSNGYRNEDIYMGINGNKLFAGYAKSNNVTNVYENTLQFPFENLNNNLWHHIVWVILPEGTWKFYFDGYLLESYYSRAYPSQVERRKCYIGNGINNIWGNLCVSNFRLYTKSLIDNEVKYLCDYTSIYSSLNISSLYLDNNLKLFYNFASYSSESLSNLNLIKATPPPKIFRSNTLVISDLSGNSYFKNGTYNIKSSSSYGVGFEPYLSFNDNTDTFWATSITGVNNYVQDPYLNGLYQGGGTNLLWSTNVSSLGNVSGEWIQVQLPYKIVLNSYSLVIRKGFISSWPVEYVIAGSNDENTWELVEYKKLSTVPNNSQLIFNITSTKDYSYFRMIIIKTNGSNFINLCQWNLTGNLFKDLGNINTFRVANIASSLVYNSTLSNKNIIVNDDIIDYIQFNSKTNDFISIDDLTLNSTDFSNGFTIALWFKSNQTKDNSKLFDLQNIFLGIKNNKLVCGVDNGSLLNNSNIYNQNINDNVWRHLAWIFTNNSWKFYINGVFVSTFDKGTLPTLNVTSTNCFFGKSNNLGDPYLDGGISDFRIYNILLNDIQVQDLYKFKLPLFFKLNKNFNLISYYPLSLDSINDSTLQISNLASGVPVQDGTLSISGLITDKNSQIGNNYASLQSNISYLTLGNFTSPNNGLSICFWFQINSLDNDQIIFEFSNNGKNIISCRLTEFSDSYFKILFTVTRVNYPTDKNNYSSYWIWLPYQEYKRWSHITWNFIPNSDNNSSNDNLYASWNIYVDGRLNSIFNKDIGYGYFYYPENLNRTTNYIGKSFLPGFSNFIGSIYDIRIYNKLLTSDEIKYFSTQRFFPVYKFFNNRISTYNFGGLYIQAYINSTDNFDFSFSKSLFLNITKNKQPDFRITSGYGINGPFDGKSVLNNIDGYSTDYLNTPISGIKPVISAVGSRLYITSLLNTTNNNSFILETYQSSLLYTKGNSVGSKGTSGDLTQYLKIVKIGDFYYDDLTKVYNIYIKKNDRVPFGVIVSNTNKINLLSSSTDISTNIINTLNIRIDRNIPYKLSLTNNYTIDLKSYYISGDISDGKQIALLNNNTLTAVNSGQIILKANVNSTSIYNSGTSIPITINILKDNQSDIKITTIPDIYFLSSLRFNFFGGNSMNPIILTTDNSNLCSMVSLDVTGLQTGTCKLTATKNEDEFYYSKSTTISIKILPIDQNFNIILNNTNLDEDGNSLLLVDPSKNFKINLLNVKETPSYITYNVSDTNLIKVSSDGFVTPLNAGLCNIEVELGNTTNYNITKNKINLKIIKNDQSPLSIGYNDDLYFKNTINFDISGGNSINSLVFDTDTVDNCSLSGNVISGIQTGTCDVIVTKPSDFMYNDISKLITLTVKPIYQPTLIVTLEKQSLSDNFYNLNVDNTQKVKLLLNGALENPVVFFAVTSELPRESEPVCTIDNNMLTPTNSGTTFIKAITSLTKNYLSTESSIIKIVVNKNQQLPLTYTLFDSVDFNTTFNINVIGGTNDKPIILFKQTENCLINNLTVQAIKAGPCYIKALKDADYKYESVSIDIKFNINKISQPIIQLSLNNVKINNNNEYDLLVNRDNAFLLYITGYSENPIITYEIFNISTSDDALCIINNNRLYPFNAGKAKIRAVLSETIDYKSSYSNYITINFNKYNQDPIVINNPSSINFKTTVFLKDTGGNINENKVYYKSSDENVVSILNGNEIKGVTAGKTTITAYKDGNFMYNPISTSFDIIVSKIKQVINITDIAKLNSIFVSETEYDLVINGLADNASVSYIISSELHEVTKKNKFTKGKETTSQETTSQEIKNKPIIIIKDNKLTGNSAGTCKITARLNETNNYLSTDTESIIITVTLKKPADFIIDNYRNMYPGSTVTITTDNGQINKGIGFFSNDSNLKINGNTFTASNSGSYPINAIKFETTEFSELSKTFQLNVYKLSQPNFQITNNILNFDALPNGIIDITTTNVFENANVILRIIEQKTVDPFNNIVGVIYENQLVIANPGYVKIIAISVETKNYNKCISTPVIFNINKKNQDPIVVNNLKDVNLNSMFNFDLQGGNTNKPYQIKSLSPECDVNNNNNLLITRKVTNQCNISISIDGDNFYNPISTIVSFKILPTDMPNFALLNLNNENNNNDIYLDKIYDLKVINVIENAIVTYNIINVNSTDQVKYVDITNDKLRPLVPGTLIIQAKTSATANYLETYSNQIIIIIYKTKQTPLVTNIPKELEYNSLHSFYVDGGSNNNPIKFLFKEDIITINNERDNIFNILSLKSGNFILTIFKDGDDIYNPVSIDISISIKKIYQPSYKILNFNENNQLFVDNQNIIPITISGSLTISGFLTNPTCVYKITNIKPLDTEICKIYNDNIIPVSQGICVLEAVSLETANYKPTMSNNSITIKVVKKIQPELSIVLSGSLNFNSSIKLKVLGGIEIKPNIVTLSNNNVKLLNDVLVGIQAGDTTITILKEEDDIYQPISKTLTVTVNKIYQPNFIIGNFDNNNVIYVNANDKIKIKAPKIYEVDTINYEIISFTSKDTSNNICSFYGDYLIPKNEGTCILRGFTQETPNYLKTYSNEINLSIIKNNQSELTIYCPDQINFNENIHITGLGGSTNNYIVYSTDSSSCSIDLNTITGTYFGKSKIIATKHGDYMYNRISKELFIDVLKINQIDFNINDINKMNEIEVDLNAKYYLTCNNVKESSNLTYYIKSMEIEVNKDDNSGISSSVDANNVVCTIVNNVVVPHNAGTCIIYAISSETDNYKSTTTPDFKIRIKLKEPADFKIDNIPVLKYGQEFFITTDNGQFNPEISFKPNVNSITIQGYKIICSNAGIYTIVAFKKGNFMYKSLKKKFQIQINKIPQPNFDILNITQPNHGTKYFEILNNTYDFYKIVDNKNNLSNTTDIKWIDKYINGINIFVFNRLTTFNWTKSIGIDFETIELGSLLDRKWIIIDICPISFNEKTITMNALIAGKFLDDNSLIIIKLKGNPRDLNSYIVQKGFKNYLINDKNLIVGTLDNYYCNIKSEGHFLYYNYGVYNTRLVDGISNVNKKLNYNNYVPNLIVSCINKKAIIIIKDYSATKISKKSSPSYILPINDIDGKSIDGIEDNKFTYGSVYILNSQYIFVYCMFDNFKTLFRIDTNSKIIKLIYKDTDNSSWGFDIIDINTIIIMTLTNYFITDNAKNDSDYYIYNSINDSYDYKQLNYSILWKSNSLQPYFTPNLNFKFYSNDRFVIIKGVGLVFFESVNDLNTYTINKPISVIYNSVNENAYIRLQLISTTSTHLDKKICYINKNQIIPLVDGSCTFKAITDETPNYNITESKLITINFELLDQDELVVKNNLDILSVDDSFDIIVGGGSNSIPVTISSLTNNIQISGYTVKCTGCGDAIIALYKEGDEYYKPTIKKIKFFIYKGTQTIILNDINKGNQLVVKNIYDLKVNGVKFDSNIRYNIVSTLSDIDYKSICYITEGNKLFTASSGVVLVKAIASETTNYLQSTSNSLIFTIMKDNYDVIQFSLSTPLLFKQSSYIIDKNSAGNINFVPITNNICTISGNLITSIGTGICVINGIKEGNTITETLIQQFEIKIDKINQPSLVLSDINYENSVRVNPKARYPLKLTGVIDNITYTFMISNNYNLNKELSDLNDVNGYIVDSKFVPIKEGYCEIVALTYENENYLATFSNKLMVRIVKTDQEKLIITKNSKLYFLGSTQLITLGGNTAYEPIYTVNNSNCFIRGDRVFGQKAGYCIITSYKKGNSIYNDITEDYEIQIIKIKQRFYIKNLNKTNIIYVDENIQIPLNLINIKENQNITYNIISSFNEGDIVITDNYLKPLYAGEYIITAQISETENYLQSISPKLYIKVIKNKQLPLTITLENLLYFRGSTKFVGEGGNTGFDILYQVEEGETDAEIINGTIIGKNTGFCKIIAIKQGDFKYEQVQEEIVVTILPIPQLNLKLININDKNTIVVNPNKNIQLNILLVEENPTIIYTVLNSNTLDGRNDDVVVINGTDLIAVNEGICNIQATTLETHNFIKTSSNILTLVVNKNIQNPLILNYTDSVNFESELIIDGTGGNNTGNYILYTSDNSNCVISENTIKFNNTGNYILLASKLGNFMYYDIQQTFTVNVVPIKQYNINVTDINYENEISVDLSILYPLSIDNYKENPIITFKVIKNIPDDKLNKEVCTIDSNNNLIATNAGKCIIRGYLTSTNNYLISETPDYYLNVIKKTAGNYIVDKIPYIPIRQSHNITINDGTFEPTIYEITCNHENLTINNNLIISNYPGQYHISITKKATFEYSALVKKFKIYIMKLNQPKILISGLETSLFVDNSKSYRLTINSMNDNPFISYKIVKNLSVDSNSQVCIFNNNLLYAIAEGICYIKVVVNETTNYNYIETPLIKITVNRRDQPPLVFNTQLTLKVNERVPLNIKGGSTSNRIIIKPKNSNCFISGNDLIGIQAGFVSVTASIDGDQQYKPTSTTVKFLINKNYQNVIFNGVNKINELYVSDIGFLLVDNIREKANIKYVISDIISDDVNVTSICYTSSNMLITTNSGRCSIQAILTETSNYYETTTSKIFVTIRKKTQERLVINGRTSRDQIIKIDSDYNDFYDINIAGGNTNSIKIIPNNDKCKIISIN